MSGSAGDPDRPMGDDIDDWSVLMARAQNGDAESYRRLLLAVTPYLRAMASSTLRNPSEIEDAVQDVMLAVHAIRRTYDPARPFKPWLAGVARHRLIDLLRKRGRLSAREVALAPEHETFAGPEANLEAGAWDGPALRAALGGLPQGQRQAIELTKLREMSLKEASVVSGMSVAALKVATHRGMQRLKRLLGGGDGEP
jgi:RNA polymerase sigma-70 factor (ECF subfamily)